MALKKLVSDLTQGLVAYPNHNTPSDSGGFNYGGSTSIFDTQLFQQRSLNYNIGNTRQDNPEPLLPQLLPGVNEEPRESIYYIDDAPDGFIRGGEVNAQKRAAWDNIRINRFFLTGEGISFINNQHALQKTNPIIQEGGPGSVSGLLSDMVGGIFGMHDTRSNINRTFNEQNLIKQITEGGYTGLYYNRAGQNPTVQSEEQNKYATVHRPGRQFDSNIIGDFNKHSGLERGNRLLTLGKKLDVGTGLSFSGLQQQSLMEQAVGFDLGGIVDTLGDIQTSFNAFVNNPLEVLSQGGNNILASGYRPGENILYQYNGGPSSKYGIGDTILYRYERTSGNYDHQGHPLSINQYFKDHPYSTEGYPMFNNMNELFTGAINENFFGGNNIFGQNSIFRPSTGEPITTDSFLTGLGTQIFGEQTVNFVSDLFNNSFGFDQQLTHAGSYTLGKVQNLDGSSNIDTQLKSILDIGPDNKFIGHAYTDKEGKGKKHKPDDVASKISKGDSSLPLGVGKVLGARKFFQKTYEGSREQPYKPQIKLFSKNSNKYKYPTNYNRNLTEFNPKAKVKGSNKNYTREERIGTGDPGATWTDRSIGVDKINALDITKIEGGNFSPHQKFRDLIKFRIEAVRTDTPQDTDLMIFRAFVDSFTDNYNANWNSFKYNGRGEEFFTYGGFKRGFSLNFKIAAQSRNEMKPLYRKLNYLVSNTAPDYSQTGRMRAPYIRFTVGSYLDRTPGFITSVNIKWRKDYPFEIALNHPEKGIDKDMYVLPHVLDVSLNFTPIHDFVPRKSQEEAPFILKKLGGDYNWLTGDDSGNRPDEVGTDKEIRIREVERNVSNFNYWSEKELKETIEQYNIEAADISNNNFQPDWQGGSWDHVPDFRNEMDRLDKLLNSPEFSNPLYGTGNTIINPNDSIGGVPSFQLDPETLEYLNNLPTYTGD